MQQIQKSVYVDTLLNPLSGKARRCALLYYFTLPNATRFYLSGEGSAATQWVNVCAA